MPFSSESFKYCAANIECRLGRVSIERVSSEAARHTNSHFNANGRTAAAYDVIIPDATAISFCQEDQSGEVPLGAYLLLKRDRFYELSSHGKLSYWRIVIPAADMRCRLSSIEDHLGMRFEQDMRMAAMLHNLVEMIADTFQHETPPNTEAFATEIVNFVMLVLSAEQRQEPTIGRHTRYRLKQRIFDFVEDNLSDASLSPQKIAKANRISLSYLYKLFRDNNTTVGQFIQAKRLQRAYELLVADPKGAVTVSEIAYLVGFKNASHFSRAFSQHFRIAPRDARQSGLLRTAPPASIAKPARELQPSFEAA
ncbi:MAG: helix-turn-helix domain-containing protein [Mesorhizobium sp.]